MGKHIRSVGWRIPFCCEEPSVAKEIWYQNACDFLGRQRLYAAPAVLISQPTIRDYVLARGLPECYSDDVTAIDVLYQLRKAAPSRRTICHRLRNGRAVLVVEPPS